MLEITDSKELTAFIKLVHRTNQMFKTRISGHADGDSRNSHYVIANGKVLSLDRTSVADVIANITYMKAEEGFSEEFNALNVDVNGKELYAFFNENKKYINKAVIDDDGILFETSIPELDYRIKKLEKNNKDVARYAESKKDGILYHVSKGEPVSSMELDDETVLELIESDAPYIIDIEGVKIRITKKILTGLTAKSKTKTVNKVKTTIKLVSKVTVSVYDTGTEDVYAVNITVDNSELPEPIVVNNLFAIVNF